MFFLGHGVLCRNGLTVINNVTMFCWSRESISAINRQGTQTVRYTLFCGRLADGRIRHWSVRFTRQLTKYEQIPNISFRSDRSQFTIVL